MSEEQRIPENTSGYARWLAGKIEKSANEMRLSPMNSLFVGMALEGYATLLDGREAAGLAFVVTATDSSGTSEVIAAANDLDVAVAAFKAATVAHPNMRLQLRHDGLIVSQHPAP